MKLLVTYKNGKTETYIGVEEIKPIKNSMGGTEAIYVETFLKSSRLEKPPLFHYRGVQKMEVFF